MTDLKLVNGAQMLEDAEYKLEEFREQWGKKHPKILKSWDANWTGLSTYFKYPQEVRTLIYTKTKRTRHSSKHPPRRRNLKRRKGKIEGAGKTTPPLHYYTTRSQPKQSHWEKYYISPVPLRSTSNTKSDGSTPARSGSVRSSPDRSSPERSRSDRYPSSPSGV